MVDVCAVRTGGQADEGVVVEGSLDNGELVVPAGIVLRVDPFGAG